MVERLRPWRSQVLATFDAVVWIVSISVYASARFEFGAVGEIPLAEAAAVGTAAACLHTALSWVMRLHLGRAALGTLEEMLLLGWVTATTGVVIAVGNLLAGRVLPLSTPIGGSLLALILMAWGRALYRRLREPSAATVADGKARAVIVGAGDAGRQLIASILGERESHWYPVALVDDDPRKRHRRIRGVPVAGTAGQVAEVADQYGASTVIIAIPSAPAPLVRDTAARVSAVGLDLKVLPSTNELFTGRVSQADVRDIDVTDLLGRHQIDTDIASIADYLTGKRVLVTGAGGSIGSELCRQIVRFSPEELIMLDRDESALHTVQLSIYGRALLDSDDVVLGDIRDTQFMHNLFEARQPQVVFHAAALKHLPMLEQYPGEAIKTNVWGTLTLLEAAREYDVEKFVNVSTDKAANPTSVLGYSKRLAECLTAAMAQETEGTYLSVRFGNVLGSRGSVLTAFKAQVAAGGPVTVTHPEVTRYFMTIAESVQLVIQAAAIGRDGEALVLDMGEPVSIDGVARQLIELSGRPIEIVYTGLREGEKMHEELFGDGEPDERPVHHLVSHTRVPALDSLSARELDPWAPPTEVTKILESMCDDLSMAVQRVSA